MIFNTEGRMSTKFELDIIWVIIIWITILSTCKSINISFSTHPSSIVKHREFCLVLQLLRFSKLSMINMSVAKFFHKGDICCLWKPTLFIQQSQDAWRIVLWRSFSKSEWLTLYTVKIRPHHFSLKNMMQDFHQKNGDHNNYAKWIKWKDIGHLKYFCWKQLVQFKTAENKNHSVPANQHTQTYRPFNKLNARLQI